MTLVNGQFDPENNQFFVDSGKTNLSTPIWQGIC